jgi:hypothetical protein
MRLVLHSTWGTVKYNWLNELNTMMPYLLSPALRALFLYPLINKYQVIQAAKNPY